MVLEAYLVKAQLCKVRIKVKVKKSSEMSGALPDTSVY